MNEIAEDYTMDAIQISCKDVGIDERASYTAIWVGSNYIMIEKNRRRTFDYYGGFEYVDADCVLEIGDYVIYYDDVRVMSVIDAANSNKEE